MSKHHLREIYGIIIGQNPFRFAITSNTTIEVKGHHVLFVHHINGIAGVGIARGVAKIVDIGVLAGQGTPIISRCQTGRSHSHKAYKLIPGVCFNIVDMIRAAVVAHPLVIGDFSFQRLRLTAGIQIKLAVLFCCRYVISRGESATVILQRRDNVQQIALALDLDRHLTVRGQCGKRIRVFELPDSIRLGNTGDIAGFCFYLVLERSPHLRILGFAQRQGRIAVGVSRAKFYGSVKAVAALLRERLGCIVPVCPAYVAAKLHLYRVRFLPNGVKLALFNVFFTVKLWSFVQVCLVCVVFPVDRANVIARLIKLACCGVIGTGAPPGKRLAGGGGNSQCIRGFQRAGFFIQHVRARRVILIVIFRAARAAIGEVGNALFVTGDVAIADIFASFIGRFTGQRILVHIVGGVEA